MFSRTSNVRARSFFYSPVQDFLGDFISVDFFFSGTTVPPRCTEKRPLQRRVKIHLQVSNPMFVFLLHVSLRFKEGSAALKVVFLPTTPIPSCLPPKSNFFFLLCREVSFFCFFAPRGDWTGRLRIHHLMLRSLLLWNVRLTQE